MASRTHATSQARAETKSESQGRLQSQRASQVATSVNELVRHTIVMLTTSYPRFPGDGIGSFVEPLAHRVAERGHQVHIVAPWHPLVRRPAREGGVHFHFFRYAPLRRLSLFGYAEGLKADVGLRPAVYLVTPFALAAWWRAVRQVARSTGASILHAHWVVPGGFFAAVSNPGLPLVISLHGSDVFVAEGNPLARAAARFAFGGSQWVTACSDELRQRALELGAKPDHTEVVPYGVDTDRFKPDADARDRVRRTRGLGSEDSLVVAAGRLVRKKGFEFLIDAVAALKNKRPRLTLLLAGSGDLEHELQDRAVQQGAADRVVFLGAVGQDQIAELLSAADIVVVPSVRDDAGNVDGLPNVLLEALASGTPVIATPVGGLGAAAIDGQTARVVPQRNREALAGAIDELLLNRKTGTRLGQRARAEMCEKFSWARVAERFENAYTRATNTTSNQLPPPEGAV